MDLHMFPFPIPLPPPSPSHPSGSSQYTNPEHPFHADHFYSELFQQMDNHVCFSLVLISFNFQKVAVFPIQFSNYLISSLRATKLLGGNRNKQNNPLQKFTERFKQ